MKKEIVFLILGIEALLVIAGDIAYIIYSSIKISAFLKGAAFVTSDFWTYSIVAAIINGCLLVQYLLYVIIRKIYYSYCRKS